MYLFGTFENTLSYISLLFLAHFLQQLIFEMPQILFLWQLLSYNSFKYDTAE